MTFSANPWLVIQRAMRTPIAASFSSPDPDAGQPVDALRRDAVVGRGADQDLFEIAHVAVHVAAIRACRSRIG